MKIFTEKCFLMSQSNLRGHSLKLNKKRVRIDVAKFSFSNRVVNEWNILDEEIILGCSLAGFKRKLDRHLRDKRRDIYISYSFLPSYRQLDDLDPLTHQVQVQVQGQFIAPSDYRYTNSLYDFLKQQFLHIYYCISSDITKDKNMQHTLW